MARIEVPVVPVAGGGCLREVKVLGVGGRSIPAARPVHLEVEVDRTVRWPAVLVDSVAAVSDDPSRCRSLALSAGVSSQTGSPIVQQIVVVLTYETGRGSSRAVLAPRVAQGAPSMRIYSKNWIYILPHEPSRRVVALIAEVVAPVPVEALLPLEVGKGAGRTRIVKFISASKTVPVAEIAYVGRPDVRICVVVAPVVLSRGGLGLGHLEVEVVGTGVYAVVVSVTVHVVS